jgi:hypothetical protein
MRKIRSFKLKDIPSLSSSEMMKINGGEYLPFDCKQEYASCAILYGAGVYTGICKKTAYDSATEPLICVMN